MPTGYKVALALGLVAILGIFGYIAFTGDQDPNDPNNTEEPYTGPSENGLRSFNDVEEITDDPSRYDNRNYIEAHHENTLDEVDEHATDLTHHDGSGRSIRDELRADEAAEDRVQIAVVERTRVLDRERRTENHVLPHRDVVSADPTRESANSISTNGTEYKIKEGDLLWNIAVEKYGNGMRHKEILAANPGLNPDNMRVGKVIILPKLDRSVQPIRTESTPVSNVPPGAKIVQVKPGETLSHIAQREYGSARDYHLLVKANPNVNTNRLRVGQSIIVPKKKESVATVERATPNGYIAHTVARGETYFDIAESYYGDKSKFRLIVDANPNVDPRRLRVGMKLILPEP